jgi:hypothetical protein
MIKIRSLGLIVILSGLVLIIIPSIASAQSLEWVGSYDSLLYPVKVMAHGNYAYIADAAHGLCILDITNPATPTLLGRFRTMWTIYDFKIQNNLAFIATGSSEPYIGEFDVVDISNPAAPSLLDTLMYQWEALNVEVIGSYAYIISYGNNHIVDIRNPSNIFNVGSFNSGYAADLFYDSLLYAACGQQGLSIYSVADTLNPQLIGNCNTPGTASAISIDDSSSGLVYIADLDSGLQIIDSSNPANPILTGSIFIPGRANDVDVAGSYAFVASDSGLTVVRVNDPASPQIVNSAVARSARSIDYENGYIYIVHQSRMDVYRFNSSGCYYVIGDINGSGVANGLDVTYAVNYFENEEWIYWCNCPPYGQIAPAGDVNGNCQFNGIDITYLVNYFKGGPILRFCPACPPVRGYRHNDIRGDCLGRTILDDTSYMSLEVIGDDLHIHHVNVSYQCCLEYLVEYQIAGNDITAIEHDIGLPCDCDCLFNLETVLNDLSPGVYHLTLIGINGNTVGSDTVSVGGY